MSHSWVARFNTLLYFSTNDKHKIKPSSSLQLFQIGNIGVVFSLIGDDFYKDLAEHGMVSFAEQGIDQVYCGISDVHLRLIRMKMPRLLIERLGTVHQDGHVLNWCLIKDRQEISFLDSSMPILPERPDVLI